MRFYTTIGLAVLVAAGAIFWLVRDPSTRLKPVSGLAKPSLELPVNAITGIEIGDIKLSKKDAAWNIDGGWPARQVEVQQLLDLLGGLETRFAPVPLTDKKALGLDSPLTVKLTSGDKVTALAFAEPPTASGNPFVRPTYLHVEGDDHAYRLAPGLMAALRRGKDDYLLRQLYSETVRAKIETPKGAGGEGELSPPAVALIDAKEIVVTAPDATWSLKRSTPLASTRPTAPISVNPEKLATAWTLATPVVDRVDPDKLRGVLAAVPELWVEQFLAERDPAKTGLDKPERTLVVKTANRELTVHIGSVSRVKETKPPAPPPANPFSPPPPAPPAIREEFRYAKLANNPQVFEVRTDKFADLFVKVADLRDPRLARFRPADAKRLTVTLPTSALTFAKEGDTWKIAAPVAAPAETSKITELLDKLSGLQAVGADVIDSSDLKKYGLADGDKVSTVAIDLSETEDGKTTDRTVTFRLGKSDTKLYVQTVGIARIDAVPDDLMKLVDRPVLAYRSRRVLDLSMSDLAKISVDRAGDPYSLAQTKGEWSLETPAKAKADVGKANAIAGDLSRLEAIEFVNFAPTPEDLKTYGLDAPLAKATLQPTDAGKPAKTVLIGTPREGKPEVYAKLADAPEVFAVREAIKQAVDQPSLAYRPLQLWQQEPTRIVRIGIERPGNAYTLSREDALWSINGPFAAKAFLPAVQPILEAAAAPRAERFEAHGDDLAKYGLDKPTVTLRVGIKGEKPDAPPADQVLLLGKTAGEGQLFAKLADQPGVFVVGATLAKAVETPALELLDRKLLAVNPAMIVKLSGTGPGGPWSAKREAEKWRIDSLTPAANGDKAVLDALAAAFTDVKATSFAAYAPSDFKPFGLDAPTATVTVSIQAGDQPVTHTIALGGPSDKNPNARYARIDNGPAVAVLSTAISTELSRSSLELVDRRVFDFAAPDLVGIKRVGGGAELSLEKKTGVWQVVTPAPAPGDDPALNEMAERLGALRAVKVAALGVKDLKPFGLDAPTATLTLNLTEKDGKPRVLKLMVGGPAAPDGRFASTGGDTIFVLPDSPTDPLVTRLTAAPIKYRERTLMRFTDADRVTIKRGERTATFAKVDGAWKMTLPVKADAEAFDLDDLILTAGKLRAEDLLADKPGEPTAFGLDKPTAELRFFLGDKEVAKLSVSNRDADGRTIVKAAGSDLVGKLDVGLSNRLLAEFRKRTLGGNLDVAQADTMIVKGEGAPTILMKNEEGWQVQGKPAAKVDATGVSEMLAAVAALKAERYVVDQKADLKLYGLEPPARVLVVRTRTGQSATVHLGRAEGDSKRVYATIPGGNGEVAVLSEADSAKLTKSAAELLTR